MGTRPALRQRLIQAILARFWDDPVFVRPVEGSTCERRAEGLYSFVYGDMTTHCDIAARQLTRLNRAFLLALSNDKYGHSLFWSVVNRQRSAPTATHSCPYSLMVFLVRL